MWARKRAQIEPQFVVVHSLHEQYGNRMRRHARHVGHRTGQVRHCGKRRRASTREAKREHATRRKSDGEDASGIHGGRPSEGRDDGVHERQVVHASLLRLSAACPGVPGKSHPPECPSAVGIDDGKAERVGRRVKPRDGAQRSPIPSVTVKRQHERDAPPCSVRRQVKQEAAATTVHLHFVIGGGAWTRSRDRAYTNEGPARAQRQRGKQRRRHRHRSWPRARHRTISVCGHGRTRRDRSDVMRSRRRR